MLRLALVALCAALAARPAAAQHPGDLLMGATQAAGGTLGVAFDFSRRVTVSETVLPGFFTATDPGFDALTEPDTTTGLVPLAPGTTIAFELLAADPGISLKIGAAIVDEAGESATFPMLHTHPEWRLAHAGSGFAYPEVTFRLIAVSGPHAPSPPYTLVVTNDPTPPTTTTSVPGQTTSTTTSTTLRGGCAAQSEVAAVARCELAALADAVALAPRDNRAARRVLGRMQRKVRGALRLAMRADAASGAKARRRWREAGARIAQVTTALDRVAGRRLPPEIAEAIGRRADVAADALALAAREA
jgi:hypothetical protein